MPSSFRQRKRKILFAHFAEEVVICKALVKSKQGHRLLDLVVDTGACTTTVPNEVMVWLGLDPLKFGEGTEIKETIITANGLIYAPVIEIPLFGALGIELHGFKVPCYDLPSQSRADGVLGLDFLSYFPPYHRFREEVLKIAPQFWKS